MKITFRKTSNFIALICVLSCMLFATSLHAQSSSVSNLLTNSPAGSFFGSVGSYFSSSNTNQPVHGRAEVGLGVVYQSGINIGADLDFRYKVYEAGTNWGFMLESVTRNAGIAGTIVSQQGGIALYYIPVSAPDVEMSSGLLGGYSFFSSGAAFTAYADVRKMATANTFLGGRIAYEYEKQSAPPVPVITTYTGFMF